MRRMTMWILASTVLVSACAGAGELTFDEAERQLADGSEPATTLATSGEPTSVDVIFEEVPVDRQVIRQADLQIHADDTRAAFDRIVALVETMGGFVANADVQPVDGPEAQPRISLTLRIPAEDLSETLSAIKEAAEEVVSESQNAQDVTDQFVDLEAQLRNLEALEIELRALLTEVRGQPDADPEKLLTVFRELSSVRGQIEQIQGQLNYLANLTELATVTVGITQTPLAAPIVEEPWAPAEAAREAVRNLVASLQTVADWAINFALFVLPILVLTLALPASIGWLVYRRVRRREAGPSAPIEA